MAKVAKQRKVSLHSRAARRATSPSIDLDKSLRSVKPPVLSGSSFRPGHHGGDSRITKASKGKQMKREKRIRLEKAVQRAEAVIDQAEKKVENSKTKGKAVKGRKVAWEDINGKLPQKPALKTKPLSTDGSEWEDFSEHGEHELAEYATTTDADGPLKSPSGLIKQGQNQDKEDVVM